MKSILLLLTVVLLVAGPAFALDFDQNVIPGVIFGTGNLNGSFTTDNSNGIQLGLRGKLRFDSNNQPQNVFNSDGNGGYAFLAGPAPGGFSWNPNSPTTPVWNFEFSVNVDAANTTGYKLSDLTYELGLDFDPSPTGTNFLVFDPITPSTSVPYWDHAFGDNSSTVGLVAGDGATYTTYLSSYNVAQNSWNYEFFNDAPYDTFDPNDIGVYDIYLNAYFGGVQVAHTQISIIINSAVANGSDSWGKVKSLFR